MDSILVLLIMVGAVLLSAVISDFIPVIAPPIIKIALGAAISFIPLVSHFHIGHEYFHLIFIAPLVYFGGMEIDRKQLWKTKGSIANMAVILVLITSIITGLALNSMIPSIAAIACITLMFALGPTDHIAVDNVEKHSGVPKHLMELLKNESVFAEVTSVILLQVGLNIMGGGHVGFGEVALEFGRLLGGGLLVGAILGIGKLLLVKFLYVQGIKSTPLHTLIGVVFPFFAYIFAEHIEVSGVVAIFLAGIISTFEYNDKVGEAKRLEHGAENVWSFLSFTLDGLIFVYLGMQIPHVLSYLKGETHAITISSALVITLATFGVILLIRFLWSLLTLPKHTYEGHVSRVKAALLFAMSGARGAITWAAISGIPSVMANGTEFPHLHEIEAIAMGVIIVSVLVSYIVLPIIAPAKKHHLNEDQLNEYKIKLYLNVANTLEAEAEPKTEAETNIVAFKFRDWADDLQMVTQRSSDTNEELDKIFHKIKGWKIEFVDKLIADGKISEHDAERYRSYQMAKTQSSTKTRSVTGHAISDFFAQRKINRLEKANIDNDTKYTYLMLSKNSDENVLNKLKEEYAVQPSEALDIYIQKYIFNISRIDYIMGKSNSDTVDEEILENIERRARALETSMIQDAYENGELPFADAKKLKNDIAYATM